MRFLIPERDKVKLIGKVFIEQMKLENDKRWVLQRISPICENCRKNKFYYIYKINRLDCLIKLFSVDVIYTIVCPECREIIELEFREFLTLEPFVLINKKLEQGKISRIEHKDKNSEIMNRLRKKLID